MLLMVRPYGDWIREHILAILADAGIATSPAETADGDDPQALVRRVLQPDMTALLVPFHAARGRGGRFADGLDIFGAAHAQGLDRRPLPIIMPVSIFAMVAFESKLKQLPPGVRHWFDRAVCVLRAPFEDHAPHVEVLRRYLAPGYARDDRPSERR